MATLIAGSVDLTDVMDRLRSGRSLFHSEADLQHSLAMVIVEMAPSFRVRLEVPVRGERSTHLDLLVEDPEAGLGSAVELKYVTRALDAPDPLTGEGFQLRSHGAPDLARLHFLRDVRRLELGASTERNGVALIVTNDASLWSQPSPRVARDQAFRLHDGRRVSGDLIWGTGDHEPNDLKLAGSYLLEWKPYSDLGTPGGVFQWLGVEVPAGVPSAGSSAAGV